MDYNTVSQLRSLAGSLMDLCEFDLIISFTNAYAGEDWQADTVTLKGCLFNEDGLESKQDDTNITKEYDLNPFDMITGEMCIRDSVYTKDTQPSIIGGAILYKNPYYN